METKSYQCGRTVSKKSRTLTSSQEIRRSGHSTLTSKKQSLQQASRSPFCHSTLTSKEQRLQQASRSPFYYSTLTSKEQRLQQASRSPFCWSLWKNCSEAAAVSRQPALALSCLNHEPRGMNDIGKETVPRVSYQSKTFLRISFSSKLFRAVPSVSRARFK